VDLQQGRSHFHAFQTRQILAGISSHINLHACCNFFPAYSSIQWQLKETAEYDQERTSPAKQNTLGRRQ
jgi:hypothetical protein